MIKIDQDALRSLPQGSHYFFCFCNISPGMSELFYPCSEGSLTNHTVLLKISLSCRELGRMDDKISADRETG